LAASKKGISSNQLHRVLGVSLKTAWFISHRIREAMRVLGMVPMGGRGIAVEADETFFGRDYMKKPKGERRGRGYAHKFKVLSLIDRASGNARSFTVDAVDGKTIIPIIRKNVAKEAMMMTDEAAHYKHLAAGFAGHEIVRHSKNEYGRGTIHTNTIEGYFSIFKRGMKGIYQHCSEKHLHRYLAEFDFRYSNRVACGVDDVERADRVLLGILGKRLTYHATDQ
jgi:transposase-like protein